MSQSPIVSLPSIDELWVEILGFLNQNPITSAIIADPYRSYTLLFGGVVLLNQLSNLILGKDIINFGAIFHLQSNEKITKSFAPFNLRALPGHPIKGKQSAADIIQVKSSSINLTLLMFLYIFNQILYAAASSLNDLISLFCLPLAFLGAYIPGTVLVSDYLSKKSYQSYLDLAMIAVSILSILEIVSFSGYYFFYYATGGYFSSFAVILTYAIIPIVSLRLGSIGSIMSFWTYANLQVFG